MNSQLILIIVVIIVLLIIHKTSVKMPLVQEPYTGSYNLDKLHEVLEKLYKGNGQYTTITKSPIAMRLLQLAIRKYKNNINKKYSNIVSKIEKVNIRLR